MVEWKGRYPKEIIIIEQSVCGMGDFIQSNEQAILIRSFVRFFSSVR